MTETVRPFRISIIGTAGRKQDGQRLNKALFLKMIQTANDIIPQYCPQDRTVELVSGGAAWADHVAVCLYLRGRPLVPRPYDLMLHFPAEYLGNECKFEEFPGSKTSPGNVANYYHSLFSRKLGRKSLFDIRSALFFGAKCTVSPGGFFERNLLVGDCDVLLAFTFSTGNEPQHGTGTHHTWKHSKATTMIHISLQHLEGSNTKEGVA